VNLVFLDTSFLLALLLSDDEHYARALNWQRHVKGQLLTTEYVLLELVDALSSNESLRRLAIDAVTLLRSDARVRIVSASTPLLNEGLDFFARRADKRWTLTDCISFVVMEAEHCTEALSSDHHFEQAGFSALLRRDPN
jgi:uncharacterized protein